MTVDACWNHVPGAPVPRTATPYVPGVVELRAQKAEAVPFAVKAGEVVGQVTVSPLVGFTTETKETVPAKLRVLVRRTVTVEPVAPVLKFTGPSAEREKLPTWLMKVAMWLLPLLVAFIVTR